MPSGGPEGELIGSGDGAVSGPAVRGTIRWSNFETQGERVCGMHPAGLIETDDGATIRFDARGWALRGRRAGGPRCRGRGGLLLSPCSFPLLLALLARGIGAGKGGGRLRAALVFGGTFAAGAAAFTVLLGLLIGLGGQGLAGSITFTSAPGIALRVAVGTLLVLLGLVQANVIPVSFHGVERALRPLGEAHARLRRDRPVAGWALFGFSYLLIGFG